MKQQGRHTRINIGENKRSHHRNERNAHQGAFDFVYFHFIGSNVFGCQGISMQMFFETVTFYACKGRNQQIWYQNIPDCHNQWHLQCQQRSQHRHNEIIFKNLFTFSNIPFPTEANIIIPSCKAILADNIFLFR